MSAGFGFTTIEQSRPYAITVSDEIDYEISFWFKQPTREPTFELSVKCFDCDFQKELKPKSIIGGANNTILIPGNVPICSLEHRWNFFHGVLYNKNQPVLNSEQPVTSHAAGRNLIMREGTNKLFVNLTVIKNCLLVWDFKIKPAGTPFSTGFVQSSGLIEVWRKNNKKDLTNEQIDTLTREYLIPYDAALSVINT